MRKTIIAFLALAATVGLAAAQDAPPAPTEPTVALTRAELQSIIDASVAAAMAQQQAAKADPALAKTRAAFAPAAPKPNNNPAQ